MFPRKFFCAEYPGQIYAKEEEWIKRTAKGAEIWKISGEIL